MSISLELSRPVRLAEAKPSRAIESPSLKNLLSVVARPSQPEPAAKVRERVAAPADSLQQRLRDSQPAARPNASVAFGKGSWGVAAQSVKSQGFGAYQTSTENYEEEGISYEKTTSTGPKGYTSTTLTYEKDGVSYIETTTSGNGKTNVRVEATSGDVTEVSTSSTTTLDGDLGDYVDDDVLGEVQANWENGVGVTTRTDTKTEVIDNSQNPPVVTVTQQSTGYSQQLNRVENLEGGENVYIHDGSMTDKTVTLPEGEYDQANSGLYVSYTVQTMPEPGSVLESGTRITGKGPDGHPIALSNTRTVTTNAQGDRQATVRYAEKGTIAREDAEEAYLNRVGSDEVLASQFSNAESEWLDYEQTTVYSGDSAWPIETSQFGELNRPGQNAISATRFQNGETEYVSFEKVSQDGARVETETHIPGTNFRSTSDTQYGENGEYTISSSSFAGDTEISSSHSSRVLAYESGQPLPKKAPQGISQDQWDQFREAHPHGPVYQDEASSWELGLDGVKTDNASQSFSVNGSLVGANSQTRAGNTDKQQYFQLDGPQSQGEMIIDGLKLAIDSQGKITLDGDEFLVPGNVLAQVGQTQDALLKLTQVLKKAPGLQSKFPSLGSGGNLLNVFTGGLQAVLANNWTDRIGGIGSLSGGVSGISGLFGTAGKVATLSKVTGYLGAGLQTTLGVVELFQKNYAEGAADIVTGAATAAALIFIANPALAAVFGAVAVVGGITRWLLDIGDEEEKKPAYDLEGSVPDWSFA